MASVREMMTRDPEQVNANATVQEAVRMMAELNIGAVPIVSSDKVQGIVTDRDVTVRVLAQDRMLAEVRVGEISTPYPVTVTPETEMTEATRLMAEHQVRRLPVVEDGRLVGMLSLGDLSVEGDTAQAGQALREISSPAEPER